MEKPAKKLTPSEAWLKIGQWCAYQERAQQEVRDKLYGYGLYGEDVEQLISRLIQEGFLNEERFAIAFAGGKFRTLGWGKTKIRYALREKRVSEPCIKLALNAIPDADYELKINAVIEKKWAMLKSTKNPLVLRHKLLQYAISRGFESDLVQKCLQRMGDSV